MENINQCKEDITTSTSIMNLSDDCLLLIYQGLDSSIDRNSFGLTCHQLFRIQNSTITSFSLYDSLTSFYNSPSTTDHPLSQVTPEIISFHIYTLLNRFHNLNSLSLSYLTTELTDIGISPLRFYGSNIRTLYLDYCFPISDLGLSFMAPGCHSLTSISLQQCHNITDIGLEALAEYCSSTLREVNLSYCELLSDNGIKCLTVKCRRLHSVTVSRCNKITGIGFDGCSETLAYVKADSCELESDGISGIVSGGGLEYLDLSNPSWSCHLPGDGLIRIGEGYGMKLRVLNLQMCRNVVSDEVVISISKGCPELQEWNLSHCHEIGLCGWEAIGLNCNMLEKLYVNQCRNLCDRGSQALRVGCRRLSVLYLGRRRGATRISDLAVELFKSRRPKVEINEEKL